jgi:plasmid stabilization system protein ParE
MKQLRILPEAWEDADEAATWYDKKGGRELGDRFLAAFRAQLPEIVRFAGTYPKVYKEFSRVFAKPFPYAIYFRIHQDWVVVALLWHTARNPEDLRTTLTERDLGD